MVNGPITVTGGPQTDSILILARREVLASASQCAAEGLHRTNIAFSGADSTLTVRVEAPEEVWGSGPSWQRFLAFLKGGPGSCRGSVEFVVTVPSRMSVKATTLNGDIRVRGVRSAELGTTNGNVEAVDAGNVHGRTINGVVSVDRAVGPVDLAAVNGSISCRFVGAVQRTDLNALNGSVKLTVPTGASAELDVQTVSGSTSVRGAELSRVTQDRKSLRGTMGSGGPLVRIRTVNGSISIETQ